MSIRNLTEPNNLVLKCENSEISSGWYLPDLSPAAKVRLLILRLMNIIIKYAEMLFI